MCLVEQHEAVKRGCWPDKIDKLGIKKEKHQANGLHVFNTMFAFRNHQIHYRP